MQIIRRVRTSARRGNPRLGENLADGSAGVGERLEDSAAPRVLGVGGELELENVNVVMTLGVAKAQSEVNAPSVGDVLSGDYSGA